MTQEDERWAQQEWGEVNLGDRRLRRRAVHMGGQMMSQAGASLSQQMGGRAALMGAYRLLSHAEVSGQKLTEPHRRATLKAATAAHTAQAEGEGQAVEAVTLLIQDRTTLDYSSHSRRMAGLGEISTTRQRRGLLLHDVLAVAAQDASVLGLAHYEVIVRDPNRLPKTGRKRSQSAEALAWEQAVHAIGHVPPGAVWVYVSDRESDIYGYLSACVTHQADYVVRAFHERVIEVKATDAGVGEEEVMHLLKRARSLQPADAAKARYSVDVPATATTPKRQADIVLSWCSVEIKPPWYGQHLRPLQVHVIRAWEPAPPTNARAVEWILLTSRPISSAQDARQCVAWYAMRWLIEDFHMCLKTGCQIERSQLDHADDLDRLLGFALPIAVRLLQLRQDVRIAPDVPAETVVEPIYVRVLLARLKLNLNLATLTLHQFWLRVAQLGGYQGRASDGPPGWRTLWHGWQLLSSLVDGARLYQSFS
jgi:hypothetical protein